MFMADFVAAEVIESHFPMITTAAVVIALATKAIGFAFIAIFNAMTAALIFQNPLIIDAAIVPAT